MSGQNKNASPIQPKTATPNEMGPSPRTGPECGNDASACRLTTTSKIQDPPIEWIPIYDGTGKMTNTDPNTFITEITCAACSGVWRDTMMVGTPKTREIVTPPVTL